MAAAPSLRDRRPEVEWRLSLVASLERSPGSPDRAGSSTVALPVREAVRGRGGRRPVAFHAPMAVSGPLPWAETTAGGLAASAQYSRSWFAQVSTRLTCLPGTVEVTVLTASAHPWGLGWRCSIGVA